MKEYKGFIYLGLLAVVTGLAIYGIDLFFKGVKAHDKLMESQMEMQRKLVYDEAFYAGMNATLKHVYYNTNTGKITLEITDVMKEMKR